MNDLRDAVLFDRPRDRLVVADVAQDEGGAVRHAPRYAVGHVVEHDEILAQLLELEAHVAADIAGAAGDQDCQ